MNLRRYQQRLKVRLANEPEFEPYRQNFIGGAVNALKDRYPGTMALVGESCFEAHAKKYIGKTPCQVRDLNFYGLDFESYLPDRPEMKALTFLRDLMRFEGRVFRAYYGHSNRQFEMLSQFPIDQIWRFLRGKAPKPKTLSRKSRLKVRWKNDALQIISI